MTRPTCGAHTAMMKPVLLPAAVAFCAMAAVPRAASAQCSNSSNPAPPPAINASYANQTFGGPPNTPLSVGGNGLYGCDGPTNLSNGLPGQPGASVMVAGTGLTVRLTPGGDFLTLGAAFYSTGGNGGAGVSGGSNVEGSGGAGGNGGSGGGLRINLQAAFVADASGNVNDVAISLAAQGGLGGAGAQAPTGGPYYGTDYGGNGGGGGTGGMIDAVIGGDVRAFRSGVGVSVYGGQGGAGGQASQGPGLPQLQGGAGGAGGQGGGATVRLSNAVVVVNGVGLAAEGIRINAAGGPGGPGGATTGYGTGSQGGDGGQGGNGGTASVIVDQSARLTVVTGLSGSAGSIAAIADGGDGGDGGKPGPSLGEGGGSGGQGGAGGKASVTMNGSLNFTGPSGSTVQSPPAVFLSANGGAGGGGGSTGGIGTPGGGGFAGDGGTVNLTLGAAGDGAIVQSTGNFAHAALAQSVGGGGGGGGAVNFFIGGAGGAGGVGGNGGMVTVDGADGQLITSGANANALLAQSIGGGGGSGGDATGVSFIAGAAIGGNGGQGGNGSTVRVDLTRGVFASLTEAGGAGLLAQSIGGAGGNGGSATLTGVGFIQLVVGGDAAGGGTGGSVNITNGGLVTSYGDHAAGIQAQSIGGGGGKGGTGVVLSGNAGPTASVAIGGGGGGGGQAHDVMLTNSGQVTTYGADAPGVLLQSVGGGGGSGGAAVARAISISPTKYIPGIAVSVALGGAGGSGNDAGPVTLTSNSGLITTAGDGSPGVVAQSVGGGGGSGGDSTAASYSNGPQSGFTLAVSTAVGGNGGTGGSGNTVRLNNSGLIVTLGQDSYGLLAQSIGGGGGTGGNGDSSATAADAKGSFSTSIAVGGSGGSGNRGGEVTLTNTGSIATRGDGAGGIFAQSVGGGGGAGGGGVASASGGKLSIAVGVGGNGGSGNNGGPATAINQNNVVTRGTAAVGLEAQSIGGGGGTAGKGGSTAGGTNAISSAKALFDDLVNGFGLNQSVTHPDTIDALLLLGTYGKEIQATVQQVRDLFTQPQLDSPTKGSVPSFNFSIAVGGKGGAAGDGDTATVNNAGSVITFGAQSDGMYAQSVGGGGGQGGFASSTDKSGNDAPIQASSSIGGQGGAGGKGGEVHADNTGTILTQGIGALGIYAQSVGGGGGQGSVAGTVNGSLKSFGLALGGNGGVAGDGGDVTVTSAGSITTTGGKNAIGILAQSVGGGGGILRTMTTDSTFDPSKLIDNPQGRLGDLQGLSLTLGGQNGAGGAGGKVKVTLSGPITTGGILGNGAVFGLNSHGIVAQSIGGGGGAAIGGQFVLPDPDKKASGNATGDGGPVMVMLNPGAIVTTNNAGAYGVIAQSIGGGGGLAGDLSKGDLNNMQTIRTNTSSAIKGNNGDGGAVTVALSGATISTNLFQAPAIFAQSVGGGGGMVANGDVLLSGTAGGTGKGDPVTVTLQSKSSVTAQLASGIVAQSAGSATGPISVSVDASSQVSGGTAFDPKNTAAIVLLGGTGNTILIDGVVNAAGGAGTAIRTDTPNSNTHLISNGHISGNFLWDEGPGSLIDNLRAGVIDAPDAISLGAAGTLRNSGTLQVGGTGRVGRTVLTGDLIQASDGVVVIDVAPGSATADQLQVTGRAVLSGKIVTNVVDGAGLKPGSGLFSVVTAAGGLVNNGVTTSGTPVVQYSLAQPDGQTLNLAYTVDFAGTQALATQGLTSPNRAEVGRALNQIFAGDPGGLGPLASRLAGLQTGQALAATLDGLSGEAAASAQQTVFAAQQAFATTVLRHAVGDSPAASGPNSPYEVTGLDPIGPPANAQGVRVWLGGFGASDVLSGTRGQGSLHSQFAGGLLGVDKWFDADRMLGVSIGGGTIDFNVADRASVGHSTSLNLAAYGTARFGAAYVSGAVAYGNYATDLRRPALGSVLGLNSGGASSLGNDVFGGRVEVGWRHQIGNVALTPFAALQVDHLWQASTTEAALGDPAANGLALRLKRTEQTSVPLTLGGRVGTSVQLAGRGLDLSAELGWVHEFSPDRSLTASFVGAPAVPFRVLGVSASRDAAQLALSAKFAVSRNVALLADVTGRFSGVETAVGGFGGVQLTW